MGRILKGLVLLSLTLPLAFSVERLPGIWANWRGPQQDGTSTETALPSSWSPQGQNLIWKVPVGGRSAPIIMGDRLYLVNTSGEGELEQEQVICLDALTGKTLWQYRFNMFQSDVPPHRIGWSSPVGDPATERIYVMGAGGTLLCLDRNGKPLWQRIMSEEFGIITTHGGRTVTPIVFEDLVITSGITALWGSHGANGHRYFAFDKMTGELIWVAQPGVRPYDTTYSTSIVASLAGKTLLVDGGADGGVYAVKARTGEKVWYLTFSKRGINASVVTDGKLVYASNGEENIDTSVMGRVVALDPSGTGELNRSAEKWRTDGLTISYASPALYNGRMYTIDNGSNLFCLDLASGKELWRLSLGTLQRASPVVADGKIYVGTENGKFYIIRPTDTEGQVLDSDQLSGSAGEEAIYASVAIARGRIFLVSTKATYAIGAARPTAATKNANISPPAGALSKEPISFVQVVPAEIILAPGQPITFKVRGYDSAGNRTADQPATWSLAGLKGNVSATGEFSSTQAPQAGEVQATVGSVKGSARVRVIPPLPWSDNFDSYAPNSVPGHWVAAPGKFQIRDVEGNKVLVKLSNEASLLRRSRTYFGPPTLSNYTTEADIYGIERRRQLPDAGIIGQRYMLVLMGNHQKVAIESWQPEEKRTVTLPFEWKGNTWYRMKLQVQTAGGKTTARGKVWPAAATEPDQWTIVKEDPIPNLSGSPGIYAYAHNEVYFDNLKVTENPK